MKQQRTDSPDQAYSSTRNALSKKKVVAVIVIAAVAVVALIGAFAYLGSRIFAAGMQS